MERTAQGNNQPGLLPLPEPQPVPPPPFQLQLNLPGVQSEPAMSDKSGPSSRGGPGAPGIWDKPGGQLNSVRIDNHIQLHVYAFMYF